MTQLPTDLAGSGENKAQDSIGLTHAKLLNGLPVAVYTCDARGYIITYNKAAVALWGREPELGKDLWCGSWKIFWPDGMPMKLDACPMARALKEGVAVIGVEIAIQRPDGSIRNILPNPVPLLDATGKVMGAINTLIDITEQKQAETKQAMLAAIIESSEDAIISKTLDGEIRSWNKAAERLFGHTESEILGKHISILIPADRAQEENVIIEKIRNNQNVDHFETIRISKNGTEIPISLTISPIRNTKGQIIGASKIARDISAQKSAEAQLQQLFENIKELNTKKDEFIGLASHELKTPVTSINALLQLIERSLPTQDSNKILVSKARNQVSKLTSLIGDLLDVSKIQTGKLPFSFTRFDLVKALKDVIETMQQTSSSHRIRLQYETEECIGEADQQRIEQVLINLISNAIKYAPDSDQVIVTIRLADNGIQVSVQDFGMGIDLPDQEQIFSRFYRVEKLTGNIPGLGIGLYISYEIIARHKGRLWVDSTVGNGSTFTFEIPFAQTA
jgi:PAS domain S-box-containing protein